MGARPTNRTERRSGPDGAFLKRQYTRVGRRRKKSESTIFPTFPRRSRERAREEIGALGVRNASETPALPGNSEAGAQEGPPEAARARHRSRRRDGDYPLRASERWSDIPGSGPWFAPRGAGPRGWRSTEGASASGPGYPAGAETEGDAVVGGVAAPVAAVGRKIEVERGSEVEARADAEPEHPALRDGEPGVKRRGAHAGEGGASVAEFALQPAPRRGGGGASRGATLPQPRDAAPGRAPGQQQAERQAPSGGARIQTHRPGRAPFPYLLMLESRPSG